MTWRSAIYTVTMKSSKLSTEPSALLRLSIFVSLSHVLLTRDCGIWQKRNIDFNFSSVLGFYIWVYDVIDKANNFMATWGFDVIDQLFPGVKLLVPERLLFL